MIFKPELVELIKQGKKTQTRRPVKDGEKECRYKPNHAYKVQPGRGQRGEETITVIAPPRQERLGDLSLKDARREGFRNTQEFERYWRGLYGSYDPDLMVWVVSFIRGDHVDMDRFLARSAPSQFCPATLPNGKRCGRAFSDDPVPQEICKCGARRPDETLSEIGYTMVAHQRLPGEPPAIPASLQDEYSKDARDRESHADWEPVHGPGERLAMEIPAARKEITRLRQQLANRGTSDRKLEMEIERMEKAAKLMEGALHRIRTRLADAA